MEGHIFHSHTKNKPFGVTCNCSLGFLTSSAILFRVDNWKCPVNLHTRSHKVLGQKTCTNFQYVCIYCPHGETLVLEEEKKRKKGEGAGRTQSCEFRKQAECNREQKRSPMQTLVRATH